VIEVFVEGRAAPKGSRIQGYTKTGKGYTRPASKFEKPWTSAVKKQVEVAVRHQTVSPPYRVQAEFLIAQPQRTRYEWPSASDLDKLLRATIDGAVQAGAMIDDRHVTALTVSKRFAKSDERPGVILCISEDLSLQVLSEAA
jgi:Holliday junction resolvase RusA-like endonuclease